MQSERCDFRLDEVPAGADDHDVFDDGDDSNFWRQFQGFNHPQ